jgi:hypothetical protein
MTPRGNKEIRMSAARFVRTLACISLLSFRVSIADGEGQTKPCVSEIQPVEVNNTTLHYRGGKCFHKPTALSPVFTCASSAELTSVSTWGPGFSPARHGTWAGPKARLYTQ